MIRGPGISPTLTQAAAWLAADFLTGADVAVLDRDGDEFVIEFADGRSFLIVATELQESRS